MAERPAPGGALQAGYEKKPSVKVSYLTSSQYGGAVLHFFQTVEAVAQRIDNVHRQRRTFAIVDTSDYSSDIHQGVTRCVAVSKIEQVCLPQDEMRILLGPFTEFDVLCQGSSMLDFIRTIGALYSPHVPGNKMILLRLENGTDVNPNETSVRCNVLQGQLRGVSAPKQQLRPPQFADAHPAGFPQSPATPDPKQGMVKSGDEPVPSAGLFAPPRSSGHGNIMGGLGGVVGTGDVSADGLPQQVYPPSAGRGDAGNHPPPPPVSYAQLTDASPLKATERAGSPPPRAPGHPPAAMTVQHVQLPQASPAPVPAQATSGSDDLRQRLAQLEEELQTRTRDQKLTEDALNKEISHLRGEVHRANVSSGGKGAWAMPRYDDAQPQQLSNASSTHLNTTAGDMGGTATTGGGGATGTTGGRPAPPPGPPPSWLEPVGRGSAAHPQQQQQQQQQHGLFNQPAAPVPYPSGGGMGGVFNAAASAPVPAPQPQPRTHAGGVVSSTAAHAATFVSPPVPPTHPYHAHAPQGTPGGHSIPRNPPPGHTVQYPHTAQSMAQQYPTSAPQPPRDSIWGF